MGPGRGDELGGDPTVYDAFHCKLDRLEFAFSHTHAYGETYFSFVNGQYTNDGGTHQSAFREGVLKGVNEFAKHGFAGEDVRDGIIHASEFARVDPYRATTHNKGVMNGIDAVALATGNDWRAVEAGAHAYAARGTHYTSLSKWTRGENGSLVGSIELPLRVGIVGGQGRRELALVATAVAQDEDPDAQQASNGDDEPAETLLDRRGVLTRRLLERSRRGRRLQRIEHEAVGARQA